MCPMSCPRHLGSGIYNSMAANDMQQVDPDSFHYRAIWISDIHLGTPGCKADYLLDFLKHNESDQLYLVGDIIDGWQLKKSWYWKQSHNDVVQKVLRKARKGTKVTYIAGNHDEVLRNFLGMAFGDIDILDEAVHVMKDGRRLWVTHGDLFDGVVQHAKWLA
ncbi:MAG: UDP-2,3-diacylglucosamine diphosphatase, partial [Betaproteobacteria bacterium]|nr:UDP-2,3-diacylglucosamine diphosphatase [Betaproteobacteria bacterium]